MCSKSESILTSDGDLPRELTIDILLRLSVKSLMRFRCVCKSWYALIKNCSFISKHHKNYDDSNKHLVVYYSDANDDGQPRNTLAFFPDETLTDISHQDIYPQLPILGQIMGPYGGIFCIYEKNHLTLWNLATREVRTLPKCRVASPPNCAVYFCNIGFELYPQRNDYKLVLLRTLWDEEMRCFHEFSHVAIYTRRTDSWRDFQGNGFIRHCLHERYDSVYLNGICYWLAYRDHIDNQVIVSFDMNDEVFHEIPWPCAPEYECGILGLYHESLSFLFFNIGASTFHIWVMKDTSWIKQSTVGPLLGVFGSLGFWKNGAFFVLSNPGQLLLYDPDTEELKDLGLKTMGIEVHTYKESLITLKQENGCFDFFDTPWDVLGVHQIDLNLS